MLTGRQIERYSRQIITDGFGGAAQERLLASRILISGDMGDIEPILPYLVGAGIGHIALDFVNRSASINDLRARFTDLNPDVQLETVDAPSESDLMLGFVWDRASGARIRGLSKHCRSLICVDDTARIVIIPVSPPCLECADIALFDQAGESDVSRNDVAQNVVAMLATIEAIKLLAGVARAEARVIEFSSCTTTSQPLHRRPSTSCGCIG